MHCCARRCTLPVPLLCEPCTFAAARLHARSQLTSNSRHDDCLSSRALCDHPPNHPHAETIIVNKPTLPNDTTTIPNQRRLRLVKSSRRGPRADRDTALGLLRACLAT